MNTPTVSFRHVDILFGRDARAGLELLDKGATRNDILKNTGLVLGCADATLDVGEVSGAFIPPDQRFYAGGPNDVRGFERNELGPVVYVVPEGGVGPDSVFPDSVRVAATGGNTLALANVELRVPSPVFSSMRPLTRSM